MALGTTNAVVLTGTMVAVGKWAQDEPLSMRIVVGGTVLVIGLATVGSYAPELASQFATLILVVAAFSYLPAIAYRLGLTNIPPPKWGNIVTRVPRNRGRATVV